MPGMSERSAASAGRLPSLATDRLTEAPDWLQRQVGDAADGFFKPAVPALVRCGGSCSQRPSTVERCGHHSPHRRRRAPDNAATLQDQLDSDLTAGLLVRGRGRRRAAARDDRCPHRRGSRTGENQNNALVNGHVAAAAHLLSRGATPTLGAACAWNAGMRPNDSNAVATPEIRQFSLVLACLNGKAAGVQWILGTGASPHDPSADLYAHGTPLHHAVCSGSLDTVKVLVVAGADPQRPIQRGNGTALGWAEHYVEERGARNENRATSRSPPICERSRG